MLAVGLALSACIAEDQDDAPCTTGCTSTETEPPIGSPVPQADEVADPPECTSREIGATRARLLTRFEYDNTVRDLLGDQTHPAAGFPAENRILAFDNDGRTHTVNPLLVEQYQTAAESIALRAAARDFDQLLPCSPSNGALACGLRFVDDFLPRAFRGPVSDHEAAPYDELIKTGLQIGTFETAIGMVIEAALQSPRFLYRMETTAPSDRAVLATPYEMASRLSYFLWGSMPDEELLAAAKRGSLADPAEVEAQARRMLADPRAHDSIVHFFMQWLDLEGLDTLPKDQGVFPEFTPSMRRSWVWSIQRYLEHVVFEQGTVETLLTEPIVYVDDVLAPLYGDRIDPTRRAGLLTQPALLAKLSHPDQTSPIRRGVFVRERILCELLPSPPNNVDTTPPDPDPNATTRERFAEHTSNPTCRGCHGLIDPIGFGFEQYDALGRFREVENGIPIDASGELTATRDPSIQGPFVGAIELSRQLAASSEVKGCLVTQLFRFAMGRAETKKDACSIERMGGTLDASGGRIDELVVAATLTDAFRMKQTEEAR